MTETKDDGACGRCGTDPLEYRFRKYFAGHRQFVFCMLTHGHPGLRMLLWDSTKREYIWLTRYTRETDDEFFDYFTGPGLDAALKTEPKPKSVGHTVPDPTAPDRVPSTSEMTMMNRRTR